MQLIQKQNIEDLEKEDPTLADKNKTGPSPESSKDSESSESSQEENKKVKTPKFKGEGPMELA